MTNWKIICSVLIINVLLVFQASAQENSPYSRYGLGDVISPNNILNRGMGGLSAAYWDLQSVNFNNPASYAKLKLLTTFDVGLEFDSRTLKADNKASYKSYNLLPAYVNIAFPLSKKKNWGMNLGFRPVTRISYDVINNTRLQGIDSVSYRYVGNGGSYQAFLGLAYGIKKLSIGINAGYMWGNKNYSTRMQFVNDTVRYQKANYSDSTNFGGLFVKAGLQYNFIISGDMNLRLGATFGLENTMKATRDLTVQTFEGNNVSIPVDSIYKVDNQEGEIVMPANYGAGFMIEKLDKWMVGMEFNTTQWDNYRYFGVKDEVKTNWTLKIGGQMIPGITSKNYWNRVAYRAGFNLGPDYVDVGSNLNTWTASYGMGLPVRRNFYTNQFTTINTSFEYGRRGNKTSAVRESFFRVTIGFNLSDIWFQKREYK
jgi:hypothetical protein